MSDDIAKLAAGLSAAQRKCIIGAQRAAEALHGADVWRVSPGGATVALCKKGLIVSREFRGLTGRSWRAYALTNPKGLALRAYLERNP